MPNESNAQLHALGQVFSDLSDTYDDSILRACPPYAEMLAELLQSIYFETDRPLRILELGCGTGNVTAQLARQFPNAHFTLVDLSQEMLDAACEKVFHTTPERVTCLQTNFLALSFPEPEFDLILSSLALHHLLDTEKRSLYQQFPQWLKPGGLFRCADECLGIPVKPISDDQFRRWEAWAAQQGSSQEEINYWKDHVEQYDHYASLADHFIWLAESGLKHPDCYWRTLMWAVFGAEKPA